MTFTEFIAKLSSVLREGASTATFTRTIFKAILPEEKQDILTYSDSTYKMLYNGKTSIHQISKKINAHIDFMEFAEYIRQYPDSAIETLCTLFSDDIPDITPYNAGDKLGTLFVSILTEAAGTSGKSNKTEQIEPIALPFAPDVLPRNEAIREGIKQLTQRFSEEEESDPFAAYIKKATAYYARVKTLLYADKPRDFREFYVCNDLSFRAWDAYSTDKLSNVTAHLLKKICGTIVISGTGGIGKSMMMRHLLFDCADHYDETGMVPVLVLLRNYKEDYTNLADVLYHTVTEFTDRVTRERFDALLHAGNCVILLDGLDEVVGKARTVLQEAVANFIKKYPDNLIVVTSRPTTSFVQMGHFLRLIIEPFEKAQALELIDKLEFYDQEVKEAFKKDLDEKLFESHKQFAGNPLLLTIMLMTYDSYGDVPAKRHIFYRKAYETMARLHDTTKGTYVRPMHTNLEPDDFAEYFSKFCAVTYQKGKIEFTTEEFCAYMDQVLARSKAIAATSKDFLRDLTDNLCILYREGDLHYFIHRSFQEYFAAVFMSGQMDDKLRSIGEFFETQKSRAIGDHTFDMLYDMVPDKVDRYIFLPHLQKIWTQCDNAHGYESFLWHQYRELYIDQGSVGRYYINEPKSFLYNFVINEQGFRGNGKLDDLPWPSAIEAFKQVEWVKVENRTITYTEWEERTRGTSGCNTHSEAYTPDICGTNYMIGVEYLYENRDKFADLIAFIESEDFPLKQEYLQVDNYLHQLDEKYNNQTDSDEWLDWL